MLVAYSLLFRFLFAWKEPILYRVEYFELTVKKSDAVGVFSRLKHIVDKLRIKTNTSGVRRIKVKLQIHRIATASHTP